VHSEKIVINMRHHDLLFQVQFSIRHRDNLKKYIKM